MILKWINNVIGSTNNVNTPAAPENARTKEQTKVPSDNGIDIINRALVEDAEELGGLVASGSASLRRKKLKENVRKKVQKHIASQFDDPDIVEEVTERIVDAAEFDPSYARLFDE